jgi:hypothetical protein
MDFLNYAMYFAYYFGGYIPYGSWTYVYQWSDITNLNQRIVLTSNYMNDYYVLIIVNSNNYDVYVTVQFNPAYLLCG